MTGQFEEAKRLFEDGTTALERRELPLAVELLTESLRLLPGRESIQNNLAAAHLLMGAFKESESIAKSVLERNPDSYEAAVNLIASLNMAGNFRGAIEYGRGLCKKNPGIAEAWNLIGIAFEKTGQCEEARGAYVTALNISPFYAEAHQNLALLDLFQQNFQEGWSRYEWRWRNPSYQSKRIFEAAPDPWDFKEPLLIWNEHGLGDQLIYCSFFPALLQLTDVPVVLISGFKLCPIFTARFGSDRVQVMSLEDFDVASTSRENFHAIPMASLPNFLWRYYRHQVTPVGGAYLSVLRGSPSHPKGPQRSKAKESVRIGVSWRSFNPQFETAKSISLPTLLNSLTQCLASSVEFVNLQYGDVDAELAAIRDQGFRFDETRLVDKSNDLMGLLGLIDSCDIVVTVSNTTAHLAGAVGAPCGVLVSRGMSRFWYWHDVAGPSPWYSSVRLLEMEGQLTMPPSIGRLQELVSQLLEGRR